MLFERPTPLQGIMELFAYCNRGNVNIISGRGSAISSAKKWKSGSIYIWVKN